MGVSRGRGDQQMKCLPWGGGWGGIHWGSEAHGRVWAGGSTGANPGVTNENMLQGEVTREWPWTRQSRVHLRHWVRVATEGTGTRGWGGDLPQCRLFCTPGAPAASCGSRGQAGRAHPPRRPQRSAPTSQVRRQAERGRRSPRGPGIDAKSRGHSGPPHKGLPPGSMLHQDLGPKRAWSLPGEHRALKIPGKTETQRPRETRLWGGVWVPAWVLWRVGPPAAPTGVPRPRPPSAPHSQESR